MSALKVSIFLGVLFFFFLKKIVLLLVVDWIWDLLARVVCIRFN